MRWNLGTAAGTVSEIHAERVTRRLGGSEITRNGLAEDPAPHVEQEDSLKLASELERA